MQDRLVAIASAVGGHEVDIFHDHQGGGQEPGEATGLADETELAAGEKDDGVFGASPGQVAGDEGFAGAGRAMEKDTVARAASGLSQDVGVLQKSQDVALD